MTQSFHVGVSGFSYASWKGKFYPQGVKNDEFLGYYSKRLDTVEINSSFYAPPSQAMVSSWSAKTGDGFKFSFKAPRQITHIQKLGKGSPQAAERLAKTIGPLGAKLGPVLFQLPPYTRKDIKLLDDFLSKTSMVKERVFEFRHESWLEPSTYETLERQRAGFCIAETEEMQPVFKVTGGLAYFRLRRDSYDSKAIDKWADRIKEASRDVDISYVYLRHDESGENALLAQRLRDSLTKSKK